MGDSRKLVVIRAVINGLRSPLSVERCLVISLDMSSQGYVAEPRYKRAVIDNEDFHMKVLECFLGMPI